jgi:hypothetical protein
VRSRVGQFLVVVALGAAVSSCGGGSGSAQSSFCVEARQASVFNTKLSTIDASDATAVKETWSAFFTAASDMSNHVPGTLRTDFPTYVTWLGALQSSLERHSYKMTDAINDDQFIALSDTKDVVASRTRVAGYFDNTCRTAQPA